MFRIGYLSFVFSTKSLMVGINMPVRTVVFLQNSEVLNAVNYKHLSGRAGRRGHDSLGHVVFYGFSKKEIQKLHLNPPQMLLTESPLNLNTVLKAMILENADKKDFKFNREHTKNRLDKLLHAPLNQRHLGNGPKKTMQWEVSSAVN
jgi:superfamily II RNA helicase